MAFLLLYPDRRKGDPDLNIIHDGVWEMKAKRTCCGAVILGFALFLVWGGLARASQCVSCHTTPAKLIPAVRELAESGVSLPRGSEQGSGEG